MTTYIKKLNHHAYCLIGASSLLQELIAELEDVHKIEAQGNPDFYQKYFANFAIDDARELMSFHEMRPVHISGKKIMIVHADNINMEAQNALLKLLEEPAEYAHFFIIVPSRHLLIPTIQSRLSFVDAQKSHSNNEDEYGADMVDGAGLKGVGLKGVGLKGAKKSTRGDARFGDSTSDDILKSGGFSATFLKSSLAKRLEIVKKIVDDISDEKKPKRYAIEFIDSLEKAIIEQKGIKESMKSLEAIQVARTYIHDRAPSLKMLLEYVAVNV